MELSRLQMEILEALNAYKWKGSREIRDDIANRYVAEGRKHALATRILAFVFRDPDLWRAVLLGSVNGNLPILDHDGLTENRVVPRQGPQVKRFPNKMEWRLTKEGKHRREMPKLKRRYGIK